MTDNPIKLERCPFCSSTDIIIDPQRSAPQCNNCGAKTSTTKLWNTRRKKRLTGTKGGDYEREICKQFSIWWTAGQRDDIFWRTSNSGGRATIRGDKSTAGSHGDMGCIDKSGEPFLDVCTVEIKRGYSGSTLWDLIDIAPTSAIKQWEKWLVKAIRDHRRAGSYTWLLVTRRDRCVPHVCISRQLYESLRITEDIIAQYTAVVSVRDKQDDSTTIVTQLDIIGMPLIDFFGIDPSAFVRISRTA